MLKMVKSAFLLTLIFTIFFGGIYPFFTFLIGRIFFPFQAGGSLLFHPQTQSIIGSALIGQSFTSPHYFHPRPSKTQAGEYNAAISHGSELGVLSPLLLEEVLSRAENYRKNNLLPEDICIPIDAVTASASGLDPHISVSNALLQGARVASARHLSQEEINLMIQGFIERPFFGILGEARINVLLLNLALDRTLIEKQK